MKRPSDFSSMLFFKSHFRRNSNSRAQMGFTLIELLLSMVILASLMLLITNVISVTQKTWSRSNTSVSQFREARMAFELISRNLSQATLNNYWQSVDTTGNTTSTFNTLGQNPAQPKSYVRQSELQFVCGNTSDLLSGAEQGKYPGHGVFFQATLGNVSSVTGGSVDTENMVNLLCGRGYFINWGDDKYFRPSILSSSNSVPTRTRYRLMEYNPTAEMNRIYDSTLRPIVSPTNPSVNFSKKWFQDAVSESAQAQSDDKDTTTTHRAFVRPVADNIIALVISPQIPNNATGNENVTKYAPNYTWDSTQTQNPGAPTPPNVAGQISQGTQHLLPPLLNITMIAVDSVGGETLAQSANGIQKELSDELAKDFKSATGYNDPDSAYNKDLASVTSLLVKKHINYRVFTTTVILKQAKWSL